MKPEKRLLAILGATLMVFIVAISIFLYPNVTQPEKAIAKSEEKKVEPKPTEKKNVEVTPTEEVISTSTPKTTTTPKVTQTSTPTPTAIPTSTKYIPFPSPKDSNERYSNLICETFSTQSECKTALELVWLEQKNGIIDPNLSSPAHNGIFYLACGQSVREKIPGYTVPEDCKKMLDPNLSISIAYQIYLESGFEGVRALQTLASGL